MSSMRDHEDSGRLDDWIVNGRDSRTSHLDDDGNPPPSDREVEEAKWRIGWALQFVLERCSSWGLSYRELDQKLAKAIEDSIDTGGMGNADAIAACERTTAAIKSLARRTNKA